jgi:hypothetical protein
MTTNLKTGDIDIDMADRLQALAHLKHIKASRITNDNKINVHASGVYFTDIPHDENGHASIDYKIAEDRNYFKVDLLNVSVYKDVKSEEHLVKLMTTEPPWDRLLKKEFCEKLIHISDYWTTIITLPEPINSIPRLAMFIAAIRPGKKHLMGKPWKEVSETIWDKTDDGFSFKRSHSVAYSHLVVVHMNLLVEQEST